MTKIKSSYSPLEDLEINSQHLASFLYILGIDESRFNDFSIDDAINLIRSRYVYKHNNPNYNIAAQEYVKKQNIVLCRGIRRCWFSIQYALYEVKNDK
jgi:hypothetical protein